MLVSHWVAIVGCTYTWNIPRMTLNVLCRLYVQWRFMRGIEAQFLALQKGFNELIPQHLLRPFDERELEVRYDSFLLYTEHVRVSSSLLLWYFTAGYVHVIIHIRSYHCLGWKSPLADLTWAWRWVHCWLSAVDLTIKFVPSDSVAYYCRTLYTSVKLETQVL